MLRISARILFVFVLPVTLAAFPPVAGAVQNPHALHLISVKSQAVKKQAPDAVPVVAPPERSSMKPAAETASSLCRVHI